MLAEEVDPRLCAALDFRLVPPRGGIQTYFRYASRRVQCYEHGICVEHLPWALGKRPLTARFTWFLASWTKLLSWQDVSRMWYSSCINHRGILRVSPRLASWPSSMNHPRLLRHALRKVFPHFFKGGFPMCRAAGSQREVNCYSLKWPGCAIELVRPITHPVTITGARCTTRKCRWSSRHRGIAAISRPRHERRRRPWSEEDAIGTEPRSLSTQSL